MSRLFDNLDEKKANDIKILAEFISVYCRKKHSGLPHKDVKIIDTRLQEIIGQKEMRLCEECERLFNHGAAKLMQCPFDPKPSCRKCQKHCYAPKYRQQIKEVMRFSGMYLVTRGRLKLIFHMFE